MIRSTTDCLMNRRVNETVGNDGIGYCTSRMEWILCKQEADVVYLMIIN